MSAADATSWADVVDAIAMLRSSGAREIVYWDPEQPGPPPSPVAPSPVPDVLGLQDDLAVLPFSLPAFGPLEGSCAPPAPPPPPTGNPLLDKLLRTTR